MYEQDLVRIKVSRPTRQVINALVDILTAEKKRGVRITQDDVIVAALRQHPRYEELPGPVQRLIADVDEDAIYEAWRDEQ